MKNYHIKNKKRFILSIVIVTLCIITLITLLVISRNKKSITADSKVEQYMENEEQDENVEEFANLQDLASSENKTTEELQEINKKEIEKNEKKQTGNQSSTTTTKNNNKNKYYIKVNYGAQVVNVYAYDKDGKYTVPVKAFVCSTGAATPTSGVYKIPAKIKWCYMYGNVYAQYCTQIVGDILFHSVPYLKRSNDTLEYWTYDKLGTKDSLGCVRLTARDAKWIFDNISYGTQVEFYSDSNPGPLGKPTAQKISNAPENLRNWDPTDPDPKNPWRTYKPKKEENEEKNTENNNTLNKSENTTENDKNNTTNSEITNNQENNEILNNETNEEQTDNTNNETLNNNIENNEIINNTENNQLTNTKTIE